MNGVLPDIIIFVLLTLVLVYMGFKSLISGFRMFRAENKAKVTAEPEAPEVKEDLEASANDSFSTDASDKETQTACIGQCGCPNPGTQNQADSTSQENESSSSTDD